jgi:hypothetical protein
VINFNSLLSAAQQYGLSVTIVLTLLVFVLCFLKRSKVSLHIIYEPENKSGDSENSDGDDNE